MSQTLEKLDDIVKNGYQIDFGNVFEHAFNNYKKIVLYAGLVLFIFTILIIVFFSISLASILGTAAMTNDFTPENFEVLMQSNIFMISIFALILSCILSPFQAAFLKMAHHGEIDKEFTVASLFSYYKAPYLKEIIAANLLIAILSLSQASIFTAINMQILGTLISYFITFITILTVPLIIFGGLKAIDAIKYSLLLVFKQPLVLLGLIIVAVIGVLLGFIGCCVGLFFTIPFIYSMSYAIYTAIVGIDDPTENELN